MPILPKDQRTFSHNFNTSVLRLPGRGHSRRRRPQRSFRGPGINNWDLSLIKNITIYERLHFQFRASAFNLSNHTQFSTMNTAPPSIRPPARRPTAKLGAFTAARDPRQMQLGLRLVF